MRLGMHYANLECKRKVCTFANDTASGVSHYGNMESPNANYLKAWRLKAGLTQEGLAEAVDTTKAVISQLENEHRALSPKWLRKLAPVLDTQPGHILDTNPENLDDDIAHIWTKISERDREQAIKVLRSFVKTGTEG